MYREEFINASIDFNEYMFIQILPDTHTLIFSLPSLLLGFVGSVKKKCTTKKL